MADKIQWRRDTKARWAQFNPILMEGEVGYETDTDQYKVGNGVNDWNTLGYRGLDCVQQKGTSKTTPMSQDKTTAYLNRTGLMVVGGFGMNETSLNIDYTNKKVIWNGLGRPIFIFNRVPYGSIDPGGGAATTPYETDMVFPANIEAGQLWLLLFNVTEKKFYAYQYTMAPTSDLDENGNIVWINVGTFQQMSGGQWLWTGSMPLSINGVAHLPNQQKIAEVALNKSTAYNYALLNAAFGNGNYINIDTVEKKIHIVGSLQLNVNNSRTSYTTLNEDTHGNTDIENWTSSSNLAIIFNRSTNKVEGYPLARGAQIPLDRNAFYMIGVVYAEVSETANPTSGWNWARGSIDGPNAWMLAVNGVKKQDGIGQHGLKVLWEKGVPEKISIYVFRLPTSFIIYDDRGVDIRVNFHRTTGDTSENTFGSRSYYPEDRLIDIRDYVIPEGSAIGTYDFASAIWIVTHNSSKDYSKPPIVVSPYSRPSSGMMSNLFLPDRPGKAVMIAHWRFGNFIAGDGTTPVPFATSTSAQAKVLTSFGFYRGKDATPLLSIDSSTRKVSFSGGRMFGYTNGKLTYDFNPVAGETDWVIPGSEAETYVVHFVCFDATEKKFYMVHFAEWSAFLGARENVLLLGEGTIESDGMMNWYGCGPININGKTYAPNQPYLPDALPEAPVHAFPFMTNKRTANLFDKSKIFKGYAPQGTNWAAHSGYWASDYIPVTAGERYKRNTDSSLWVYPFDENKLPIQGLGTEGSNCAWSGPEWSALTAIPEGVAFVRVLFSPANIDVFMFGKYDADFSSYVPYMLVQVMDEYLPSEIGTANADINTFGKSEVGNLQYQEIGTTDYAQIILYGQSLSMGWEAPEVITTTPIDGNFMVGNSPLINHGNNHDGTLHSLIAVKWSSGGEQPIVGCVNSFSKLYRRFVNKSQMFIGSSAGEGGQSIEKLSKECTNVTDSDINNNLYHIEFLRLLDQTKAAADSENKTVSVPAILYMQGEHNYVGSGLGMTPGTEATKDKGTYKALLKALKENMQADVMAKYGQTEKPLFFIYEVAGSYINRRDMSINMAQVEFAMENDDVFLLNPTYGMPDYNGGHLSTNGYRWYGELIAHSLYDVFVRGASFKKPVFPMKYTVKGSQILIDFYVPVLPLVFDTWTKETIAKMGFKVFMNSTEVTINDLSIKNNRVILTCASQLSGTIEITYAGQGSSGSGNLRDSDEYRSLYTYFDDRTTSPSKRENYTPKDREGEFIYGLPHPMYNWCSNFYKLLDI